MHILGTAWWIQKLKVSHPKRIRTEKFVCFCSGSVELQMCEKGILTGLLHTPGFLAAQHTNVCLDSHLNYRYRYSYSHSSHK